MNIAISKELRWFFKSDGARPIQDWFGGLKTAQKFGDDDFYRWQDYYLSIPGAKNLGIKIREPKKDAPPVRKKQLWK